MASGSAGSRTPGTGASRGVAGSTSGASPTWAASQGVPTASVRAAYVYVDYPGGRVDELTAEGLLSIQQIQAALTVG